MSRIGKAPIAIPEKVKVTLTPPTLTVEGPEGCAEHVGFGLGQGRHG